jgi:PAS domain S-box-containing protein
MWDMDMRSGAVTWSEQNYALHGLDPAKPPPGRLEWQACIHEADRSGVLAVIDDVRAGRTSELRAEFRVICGARPRWLWTLGRAVERATDGKPLRLSGITLDITDRKRNEVLLAKRTALLDAYTASAPVGFAFVDGTGRYVRVNEALARMNGIPAEAHIGRTVAEVVPQLWPQLETMYRQALSGNILSNVEVSNNTTEEARPRGHWLVTYYPIRLDDKIAGVGFVVVDITAQKRTEALLKEADRRKNDFIALLAHELRNPLAPIRNAVEILKLQGAQDAISLSAREMIERQVHQLVRLVDDLLDVSRITRGKLELRCERIAIHQALQLAIESCAEEIRQCGHELTVTEPQLPLYVYGDAARLAQVFANLLDNACKYTPRGGRVSVTLAARESQVSVCIRDTGIGIPAERREAIFQMFSQLDSPMDRSYGGLGIGLALSKTLVEMHGGTLEVSSEGIGRGSAFTVSLPMERRRSMDVLDDARRGEMPGPGAYRRVLVVDDNRDSADSLARLLTMHGHEVAAAYDGEEAVRRMLDFAPDLVILDIGMPKMNGYEACRRMRAQEHGHRAAILALTGWGQEEDRRRSREAGFDGHLVKPLEYEALRALLSSLDIDGPGARAALMPR